MKPRQITMYVLIGAVAIFVIMGLVMPNSVSVERSALVNTPVGDAYRLAADLTNHPLWNARKMRDKTMRFSYPRPKTAGQGAVYTWTSEESDIGRLEITKAVPSKTLTMHVALEGKGEGKAGWRFEPSGNQTKITRSFRTEIPMPIFGPWILLLLDIEGNVGRDFELELRAFSKTAQGMTFDG